MTGPSEGLTEDSPQDGLDWKILLLTSRTVLDADARDRLRALPLETADWSAVIRAALDHGTAGLVCHQLMTDGGFALAPDLQGAADSYLAFLRDRAEAAIGELLTILDALAADNIAAIPFKGPAIGALAYGRTDLRGQRDLDVLIREAQVEPAMRVLAGLGYLSQVGGLRTAQMRAYYRYNGQDMLCATDRLPLEPHWAFAPRTFGIRLRTAEVWARATQVPLGGRTVPCLSPEDTLIAAALHGCKEQWARLIWVADIAEHVRRHPDLDWAFVLCLAARSGLRRTVLLAALLAAQMLQAPLPDWVARQALADRTCRKLAGTVARRLRHGHGAQRSVFALSLFQWRVRERLADRLRYVFASVMTARVQHLRMIDLPDRLAFAYPALKVAHDYLALPIWLAGKAILAGRPARRAE
jgi:hypothetical protein